MITPVPVNTPAAWPFPQSFSGHALPRPAPIPEPSAPIEDAPF